MTSGAGQSAELMESLNETSEYGTDVAVAVYTAPAALQEDQNRPEQAYSNISFQGPSAQLTEQKLKNKPRQRRNDHK